MPCCVLCFLCLITLLLSTIKREKNIFFSLLTQKEKNKKKKCFISLHSRLLSLLVHTFVRANAIFVPFRVFIQQKEKKETRILDFIQPSPLDYSKIITYVIFFLLLKRYFRHLIFKNCECGEGPSPSSPLGDF